MKITLQNGTCVLVGSLNRAILQPPWLVDNDLIPSGAEPPPMDLLMRAGQPSLHRIEAEDSTWLIETGKLQIEAKDPTSDVDPGAKVDSLLKILEHTPVLGVGNNFTFVADSESLLDADQSPVVASLKTAFGGGELGTMVFFAHVEDSRVQVTIDRADGGVLFHFNFHRDTRSAAKAREIAQLWKKDRETALRLVDAMKKVLA